MTVKELIEKLSEFPEDFLVVLSSDEEGNEFNELSGFGIGLYDPEYREFSSWDEEVGVKPVPRTIDNSNALSLWP